jgi:hypothetical protein
VLLVETKDSSSSFSLWKPVFESFRLKSPIVRSQKFTVEIKSRQMATYLPKPACLLRQRKLECRGRKIVKRKLVGILGGGGVLVKAGKRRITFQNLRRRPEIRFVLRTRMNHNT